MWVRFAGMSKKLHERLAFLAVFAWGLGINGLIVFPTGLNMPLPLALALIGIGGLGIYFLRRPQ